MPLGLSRAGDLPGIQRHGGCRQAVAVGVEAIDLADDLGLGRLDDPADANAPALAVAIGGGPVIERLASIPEGDAAGAEPLQGLPFQPALCMPAQLPDVLRVHSAVDGQQELGVFPTGVKPLIDEEQVNTMEPEFPELPHRIDHIAAQARRIVDEDEVEAARLAERHLDELLQPMTTFDTRASDGLI